MSLTFNKFKDTSVYGNFINDSSGTYIADATFKGNLSCNGNINLSKSLFTSYINPISGGTLNLACDKPDENIYIGNKASLITLNSKRIELNDGTLDNSSFFQSNALSMDFTNRSMYLNNMDVTFEKVGTINKTTTFNTKSTFNDSVNFNVDVSFNKNISITGNINLGLNSKIYNSNGTEFTSGSGGGFNSNLNEIKIGGNAGVSSQNLNCVAIGGNAGSISQGLYDDIGPSIGNSIAIGFKAGETNQKTNSIAIGKNCGQSGQGYTSIAIGRDSGTTNQGTNCIAFGTRCGELNQGNGAYALGQGCGQENQGQGALALGYMAGRFNQGYASIGIGYQAGYQDQHMKSIVINASDISVNTITPDACYINPIRFHAIPTNNALAYDPTSKEIFYTTNIISNDVSNNYLKTIDANDIYLQITDASNTYLKTVDASNTYLKTVDASNNYLKTVDASNNYLMKVDASNTYLKTVDASNTYMKIGTPTTGTINATNLNVSGKMTTPYASFSIDSTISSDYSGYFIQVQGNTYGVVTLFSASTFGAAGNPNANIKIQNVLGANNLLTITSPNSTFYSNGNNGSPAIALQYLEIVSLVSNGYAWSIVSTSHPPLTTKGLNSNSSIYLTNLYTRCSVINTNNTYLTDGGGVYLVYATTINMTTALYHAGYDALGSKTFANKEQEPIFHIFNGSGTNNLTINFPTIAANTINYPPEGAQGLYGRDSAGLISGATSYTVLPYQSVTLTPTGTYWLLLSKTG